MKAPAVVTRFLIPSSELCLCSAFGIGKDKRRDVALLLKEAMQHVTDSELCHLTCTMAVDLLRTTSMLLLALLVVVLANVLFRICFHPLAKIPGPRLAKITRLWQSWRYYRGTWHDDILQLHGRYGPLVRIAPNEVSFVDARESLEAVYGHGAKTLKVWRNRNPLVTAAYLLYSNFRLVRLV